jgi:hypothetical protein
VTAPPPRRAALLLAAVLLPVALQALALLNPDVPIIDCEERYNAGHALALARHPAALLRLQYRDFCGGCTLVSALGAVPMAVLPPVFATWKLVALGFTGLLGGAGAWLLDRRAGRAAAVAFVALVALMPWNLVRLSLLSWGNHVEVGVMAVGALALLARPGRGAAVAAGVVTGLGLWTGFSMGPLAVGLVAGLVLKRSWRVLPAFAAGLLIAPLLWLAQWASAGTSAFGTIYVPGESTPDLLRAPRKLLTLLRPQQVAGLFGLPDVRWGVPLGYGWVIALGVGLVAAVRRPGVARDAALLALAWLGAYMAVGFSLETPPWPEVAPPPGLRYAAPLYPAAFLVLAAVAGRWWAGGRRAWAVALLAVPLGSGLLARAATLTAPFPDTFALRMQAADLPYFRFQASYLLDPEEHRSCAGAGDGRPGVHAYAEGRLAAAAALEQRLDLSGLTPPEGRPLEPWAEGVGGQTIDRLDGGSSGATSLLAETARATAVLGEQGQLRAVDEAVWRRVWRNKRWSLGKGDIAALDAEDLARRARALDAVRGAHAGVLRDAVLRAHGRRWARELARTAQPTRLEGPTGVDAGLAVAFWAGAGEGLGAEWGPRAAIPRPGGLPGGAAEAAFGAGYARGVARQWVGEGAAPVLSDAAGPDLGADRWWGPPSPLLCPCGSTCE